MPKKILLVDDSRTALMIERMILAQRSYDLVTASDGEEALTRAREERPDLILMDVVMPRLDGFSATRRLRAEPSTAAIPIILVTTRGEPSQVETGFVAGCSDYVTKPINSMELLVKVRNVLGD
jgi:CheY-like chemotaxis protein